jgi:hypothetical protein
MGDAPKRMPAYRVAATFAAVTFLALRASAGAAEAPDRPAEPLRFRLGVSALSGYPDLFGIQLDLWMPNRFVVEAGASSAFLVPLRSAYVRVVFPWAFPTGGGRVALSPAVGLRWMRQEEFSLMPSMGCSSSHGCTHSVENYNEFSLLGVNAVLGMDWVRMLAAHVGLFAQLIGGVTVRVAGYDDHVERTTDYDIGLDDMVVTYKRHDNGRVRPDVRFAFGFVF